MARRVGNGREVRSGCDAGPRVEPAHREAYVDLGPGGRIDAAQWQLADEALRAYCEPEPASRASIRSSCR
jgi:hypothetical protein